MMYRSADLPGVFPDLIAVQSTRHGGVSPVPYHSLNLGLFTEDDPGCVRENRRRFFEALGISEEAVASARQVHGDRILVAETSGLYEGYDALVTQQKGLFVGVSIADCTPILVYDAARQAVAAIHAGWKGTVLEIVRKTLEIMQQTFGTQPADCYAWVGTCIGDCEYEVGDEVAQHFLPAFKTWQEDRGKFTLDLKAANKALLTNWGIPETHIGVSPWSTGLHREDYFSHRFENGTTGRMMAIIGLRKA